MVRLTVFTLSLNSSPIVFLNIRIFTAFILLASSLHFLYAYARTRLKYVIGNTRNYLYRNVI
jgi:hypothetical protein